MEKAITLNKKYSYNEYVKLEKDTREKHDFYFGEVYNMAGGTKKHNILVQRILLSFYKKFQKKSCQIFMENVKLEIIPNQFYVYPDLMLTCDKEDLKDEQETVIKKPVIIIEILSNSTELYDRNIKMKYYLKIPSLKYYVLVSQNKISIEIYERTNSHFEYRFYEKTEDIIKFKQLDFDLSVDDIY